ncbi:MAG: chemotaxis protein [Phormidium sp. GEM2.Bin31]|nr:MAG: chemotaxis protein [Phormidium sp. GEM2.Bin31]
MKINQVVFLGFGVVFAVAGISSLVSQQNLQISDDADRLIFQTFEMKFELQKLETNLLNAETGQRGFILTNDSNKLAPYQESESLIAEDLRSLQQLIRDNPNQRQRAQELEDLAQSKLRELEQTIRLQQIGNQAQARQIIASGEGQQIMNQIRQKIAEMITVEEELLEQRKAQANQMSVIATAVNWGGLILIIIVGSVASYIVIRVIMHPIDEVTGMIANSSAEIAVSASQQEKAASDQAVSIRQTTTTLDELAVSAQQSSKQAQASLDSAQKALTLSSAGNEAVQETLVNMGELKNNVNEVSEQIQVLTQYTSQIDMISGMVSQLANQTNMLALNASVEAVRAGEYGRGFNVVAQEIRKLADQSYGAAGKINTLIDTIQSTIQVTVNITHQGTQKVSQGMTLTEKTASLFGDVSGAIDDVVMSSQQISLTSQQQAIAIQQVVDIASQINNAAIETVSGMTQTKVSTQQLNEAAQTLQELL